MMNDEKGFTLLEVLIAVIILTVALLGLSSMNVYTIKYNDNAKRNTAAVALAQDKLEALKNLSFTDSALNDSNTNNNATYTKNPYDTYLTSTTNYDSRETNIDEKGNAGGIYTRIVNIADYSAGTANTYPNTKLIVVIVTWTDQTGSNSVTLTTMKGCKEFNAAGTTCTG